MTRVTIIERMFSFNKRRRSFETIKAFEIPIFLDVVDRQSSDPDLEILSHRQGTNRGLLHIACIT